MKLLITLELTLLLLATTFQSHNPPGWFQQQLPVEGFINDIFFLDSLNGWVVFDNGYIIRTTNGGNNWSVQIDSAGNLYAIQFLDSSTGYALGNGNHGIIYKTTNGGTNWILIYNFNPAATFRDASFINKDTGWVCSADIFDGGVFRTTNGGINWQHQLNYASENPRVVFFTNKDTGWAGNAFRKLFKSTNGGQDWNLQTMFPASVRDILFFNSSTGLVSAGRIYKTINGGVSWDTANDGGIKISFANDSTGWLGNNFITIKKTTNGGMIWFTQITNTNNPTPFANTDLNAWAGGNNLAQTTDGGGLSSIIQNAEMISKYFKLSQNYPNPFNPNTNVSYELVTEGYVKLDVYDIAGKHVQTLTDQKQSIGEYHVRFDGSNLTSGVYYYRLILTDTKSDQVFSNTKKMLLLK
jgi:photosystem II stability/assembly factor-like uncharacterized protein